MRTRRFYPPGFAFTAGSTVAGHHKRSRSSEFSDLRGANAGKIPVEQPTEFDFVINLKTAKVPSNLLLTQSGHEAPYSITSSAVVSSVVGTVRPIALAVLRLIASSYLVGSCTGRLAGFSPLRMRST